MPKADGKIRKRSEDQICVNSASSAERVPSGVVPAPQAMEANAAAVAEVALVAPVDKAPVGGTGGSALAMEEVAQPEKATGEDTSSYSESDDDAGRRRSPSNVRDPTPPREPVSPSMPAIQPPCLPLTADERAELEKFRHEFQLRTKVDAEKRHVGAPGLAQTISAAGAPGRRPRSRSPSGAPQRDLKAELLLHKPPPGHGPRLTGPPGPRGGNLPAWPPEPRAEVARRVAMVSDKIAGGLKTRARASSVPLILRSAREVSPLLFPLHLRSSEQVARAATPPTPFQVGQVARRVLFNKATRSTRMELVLRSREQVEAAELAELAVPVEAGAEAGAKPIERGAEPAVTVVPQPAEVPAPITEAQSDAFDDLQADFDTDNVEVASGSAVVDAGSEADSARPAVAGAESQEAAEEAEEWEEEEEDEAEWDCEEEWEWEEEEEEEGYEGQETRGQEQAWLARRLALSKAGEQGRKGLGPEDEPEPAEWCETWSFHRKQPNEKPYTRMAYNSQVSVGTLSYGNWNGFRSISLSHLWSDLKTNPNAMVMAQGMNRSSWERLMLPERIASERKKQYQIISQSKRWELCIFVKRCLVRDVDVHEDSTVVLKNGRSYSAAQFLVAVPSYTKPILGTTGHPVLTGRVGTLASLLDAPSIAEGLASMILRHNVRVVGGSWGCLGSELLRLLRGNSMQVNVASWSPVAPADDSDTVVLQPSTIWVVGNFRAVSPLHMSQPLPQCSEDHIADLGPAESVPASHWPPRCAEFMPADGVQDTMSTNHLPDMPPAFQKLCMIVHEGMTKVQVFVGDKPRRSPEALAKRFERCDVHYNKRRKVMTQLDVVGGAPAVAEDEAGHWVWEPAEGAQKEESWVEQGGTETAPGQRTRRKRSQAPAEDFSTAAGQGPPRVLQEQDVMQRNQQAAIRWTEQHLEHLKLANARTWQRTIGRGRGSRH